jgi:hypothetical protein
MRAKSTTASTNNRQLTWQPSQDTDPAKPSALQHADRAHVNVLGTIKQRDLGLSVPVALAAAKTRRVALAQAGVWSTAVSRNSCTDHGTSS